MRKLIIGLTVVFACAQKQVQKIEVTEPSFEALELLSHAQLIPFDTNAFDLSGIVLHQKKCYVIADKRWNKFIYQIGFDNNQWTVVDQIPFSSDYELDLEAIDQCNGTYYFADERSGKVFFKPQNGDFTAMEIDYTSIDIDPSSWKNAGWEGMAVDCERNLLYLTKERQPRFIVTVDLASKMALSKFNIPETESNDFADAKFENGHLYLLERNGNYIAKVDLSTRQVIEKYHYRHIASHPDGKLFGPTKYGMAEALLLTPDEIWLGLDNNGDSVTPYARRTYQIEGTAPVILKFKRPDGF